MTLLTLLGLTLPTLVTPSYLLNTSDSPECTLSYHKDANLKHVKGESWIYTRATII
jgi:hypothetical protein